MHEDHRFGVHKNPVWRDRANFVFQAEVDTNDVDNENPGANIIRVEQLWGRELERRTVEVCCIPFFIYGVALGDIVEVDEENVLQRVVHQSGRLVFRIWFGRAVGPSQDEVAAQLVALGALVEWFSPNLLAIDTVDEHLARLVSAALLERQDREELIYETGRAV